MSDWDPPLVTLLELQRRLERGPKREGAFALWMLVRIALDQGLSPDRPDKADRRRITLLASRLAPLAVPRPLARGLTTALGHLEDGTTSGARIALAQLVAPTKDALGSEAADAVALAARMVHDRRATPQE
jgi:hypothetical protein